MSEFPNWVQNIITQIYSPPAINFEADYKEVPLTIKADYIYTLTNKDKAVIKLAKIELDRLYKRILKSNSNPRGKKHNSDKIVT